MPEIAVRPVDAAAMASLVGAGIDPRLARLFAARGVSKASALSTSLPSLLAPELLAHIDDAARLLADAIAAKKRLLIIADYDADGATACAVGVRALRAMGATVDYLVPNRFEFGYGLTPEIVQLAAGKKPDILITVDNGIASVAGVDAANALGIAVLVTDHHLPGAELPRAACIVNPNQEGCGFPSKNLAGVGVIFYVMTALRAELRRREMFGARGGPNLAELLDIVALGTVADVVRLDTNNRILVSQGLGRLRAGRACAGIAALFEVGGRPIERATAFDLGFVAGPRLNAAGRLDDMSVGIELLITDDKVRAGGLARKLDALNRERRAIEADMQDSALAMLDGVDPGDGYTLSVHHADWHQGVVGLLASRLKDRYHRPAFAFATDATGALKGSGRSIPGLHLRDALDLLDKRTPGLIERFGGHAAAAGATIGAGHFVQFRARFEAVVRELIGPADLERRIETDGAIDSHELSFEFAQLLRGQVWGQGFPEPRFTGRFRVEQQRVVGEKHLRLSLALDGRRFPAVQFGSVEPLPEDIDAVFRLDVNEYQGAESVQLVVEHWSRPV